MATDPLTILSSQLENISARLERLETGDRTGEGNNIPQIQSQNFSSSESTAPPQARANESAEHFEFQSAFQVIADSVGRVRVNPDYMVRTQRQGLQRAERESMNIVSKCAKYFETTLKLLSLLQVGEPMSEEELDDLTTVQVAAVKYLQDEVASIIVAGTFDQNTQKTFKTLQSNQSVFTNRSITNLERAVAVSAAAGKSAKSQRGQKSGYQYNYNNTQYQPRGGRRSDWRGGYRNFGGRHQGQGPSDNVQED